MSELVTLIDGKAVTNTLTIADGTENEHASVILLVRKYQADLQEFGQVDFKSTRPERGGHPVEFATLNEQQSTLLLTYMRNTDIVRRFKKSLVKAFFDLMQRVATASLDPTNLSRLQLIEIALQAETERLALEHQVAELAPKAEALDRIADADGAMNCTVAAKTLQVRPKTLFDWLRANRWIYRLAGGKSNVAYQDKIQAGYLTHKATTVTYEDGTEKVFEQVLVTAKGLARLSQAFGATA